jgi:hypothetical protein
MYIEDFLKECEDVRALAFEQRAAEEKEETEVRQLEVMTEVPRRRRPLKKGELLGRQTTYRDFSIVHVDSAVSDKTNRQWKEEGRQTLFGEAMAKARKKEIDDQMAEQGTFITAAPNAGLIPLTLGCYHLILSLALTLPLSLSLLFSGEDEGAAIADAIADNVMAQVAASFGIGNTAELLQMRDLNKTGMFMTAGDSDEEENEPEDNVPTALFGGNTMAPTDTLETQPLALNTALRALRFAVGHPLTNYSEVCQETRTLAIMHSSQIDHLTANSAIMSNTIHTNYSPLLFSSSSYYYYYYYSGTC